MQTIEQQIANLRPTVRSGIASNLHKWMIGIALLLVIASIIWWHPVPLMVALFLGLVGLAERQAGPNLAAAVKAYETQVPTEGTVSLSIRRGDDEPIYHAVIMEAEQPQWRFQFIPQGWQPVEGEHPIRIWRFDDNSPPVLAVTELGLLIPRYKPELVE